MEEMQDTLVEFTGAVNAILAQMKGIETRMSKLEEPP